MAGTILTREQFFQRLGEDAFDGSEYGVNFAVAINEVVIDWEFRVIQNVTFEHVVRVSGDIRSGFLFNNCNFKKGIVFRGATTLNFNTAHNDLNASLVFANCKADHITFADNCQFQRGVVIKSGSVIEKKVGFYDSVLRGTFKIDNSEINNLLDFRNCNITSLTIQNKSKIKSLRLESFRGDIALIKSTFTDNVKFRDIETPNSLSLNYNNFEDTFDIKASRISAFYSHGDTFKRRAKLENRDDSGQNIEAYLNKLYLTDVNLIEGFEFDGMSNELQELKLPLTTSFSGVLRLMGWKIKSTNISGINQNLKLIFANVLFGQLTFNDFSNFADITFDRSGANPDFDEESFIIAANTDFGNSKFNEFNFNSFNFINLSNTSFNNIVATNVIWFEESQIRINSSTINSSQSFRRIREVYRQIKQSLISQGNQIDSLEFKAKEMRAYRNELVASAKEGGKYKLSDKAIMTVNQTNNYGLSWWKPVWIICLLTLVFYIIELPLFSKEINYTLAKSWEDVGVTFCVFWNNFNVFWQMFNPARKFSSIYGENIIAFLYFLDFLHRLILGIFIFQIIKAFRRFASK